MVIFHDVTMNTQSGKRKVRLSVTVNPELKALAEEIALEAEEAPLELGEEVEEIESEAEEVPLELEEGIEEMELEAEEAAPPELEEEIEEILR